MRKFVISLAAATAALAVASPAAAQYYPQAQPYGYNGYNGYNGYGYNGYGQVRALQQRIDVLQNRLRHVGVRGKSAQRLREESRSLERRLHYAARNGLNPYEVNDIANRITRLEQRVAYTTQRGQGRYAGYNRYDHNGYDGYYRDDDHDYDRGHHRDDDHRYGHDRDDD